MSYLTHTDEIQIREYFRLRNGKKKTVKRISK